MREFIEDFRPDFIGADSLRTIICHPTGISENDIEIGSYLNKLIQEATRFGSTFLLIHHENKSAEFKGVSKSSGSGDIPARFDIHWRLEKPFENDETRVFSTAKTRSSSRAGRLMLNVDECRFELERWEMESPEFSQALSSTISRIDHLLNINPQGLAIWDIESLMENAGTSISIRSIRRCLAQMTASQSIGRKQHPKNERAFLYYKLQPNGDDSNFSSDTSHSNYSEVLEKPQILVGKENIAVTPTMTSNETQNASEIPEKQMQQVFESDCDSFPEKGEIQKKNVVPKADEEKDTTQDDYDDIVVGKQVEILAGHSEGKHGIVQKVDAKRLPNSYDVVLENGIVIQEPGFNLKLK